MEWIGTGFVLTIGSLRLRVRIALEETPHECTAHGKAPAFAREERDGDRPIRRSYRIHPR
jgi:hypothetical protein